MVGLNPILNLRNDYRPSFKSAQPPEIKEEQNNYTDVLSALAITAGVATLGIYGGKEIYKKYFDKLACGVKKGEISEALFNFIKNNDPKGKLFNNKASVIELNNGLTDEKLIILKQLAKMQESTGLQKGHRFSLNDIKTLLKETNEENIKYLEQLAKKSENLGHDRVKTYSPPQILEVLYCINSENKKVAQELIDAAGIRSEEITRLCECLKNVNKDNIDIWRILLSTRKKGVNLEDLAKLAKKVEETQNPKCAEILLNADKKNGSGLYIHNIDDILGILPSLKEENIEIYRKFYELKSTSSISSKQCTNILSILNEHNIEVVDSLLSKKDLNGRKVVFDNYAKIVTILELINKDNKEVAKRLIDLTESQYSYSVSYSYNTSDNLIEVLEKLESEAERERAVKLLNDSNITSFSKFLDEFFKH